MRKKKKNNFIKEIYSRIEIIPLSIKVGNKNAT